MKILDLKDLNHYSEYSCVTLGFFDGIHLGHQAILNTLINKAKAKSVLKGQDMLTYPDVVIEIFNYTQREISLESLVQYMSNAGIPQTTISHELNISLRQVKQIMNKSTQL